MPTHAGPDLFASADPERRLHPNFRALRDSPFHGDARTFMNALYRRMGDPNGNYVRDFQGEGFHARLFELACFAYLESDGFVLDRSYDRPDFVASRNGVTIALEATTASPSDGDDIDLSILRMKATSGEELVQKVGSEFPRRILAVLRKKLKKRYHRLPQCVGKPLVFVVAPYFEPGSVQYPDDALVACLYGFSDPGLPQLPETPLFMTRGSESVSAVLYCNQFTVPRFWRLAPKGGGTSSFSATRVGMCFVDYSATEFKIRPYRHDLRDTSIPRETWAEGVTIFHNPNAAVALPPNCLPCTSAFHVDGDGLRRDVHGFHPVTSFMRVTTDGAERAGVG